MHQKFYKTTTPQNQDLDYNMYTGPNIITDGLVLYLDAANPISYPMAGTAFNNWFLNSNSWANFSIEAFPSSLSIF